MDKYLGIDEAGKGCVIGPMVIAGVITSKNGIKALSNIGYLILNYILMKDF